MNQSEWDAMTPKQRDLARDNSQLSPQLIGLEGYRVEADGRRFIVGRSTGWVPIHLEVKTRRSRGGGPAEQRYGHIRVLEYVR